MIPVDMEVYKDNLGDCFRACVASIFEFPVGDMPNFWEQTQDAAIFWELVDKWTSSKMGYKTIPLKVTQGLEFLIKDIICIACGSTPRSREQHAVVWKNGCIHDPNPSRCGIGDPEVFVIFAPMDIKGALI